MITHAGTLPELTRIDVTGLGMDHGMGEDPLALLTEAVDAAEIQLHKRRDV